MAKKRLGTTTQVELPPMGRLDVRAQQAGVTVSSWDAGDGRMLRTTIWRRGEAVLTLENEWATDSTLLHATLEAVLTRLAC